MPLLRDRSSARSALGRGRELDFDEMRFGFTFVAEGVVVGGAEHPLLLLDIPFGPGVEGDEVRAATLAKEGQPLAAVRHAASLPLPSRRSNQ